MEKAVTSMKITLELCERMADAAIQKASELGIQVTFAFADAGGDLMILKRMDDAASYTVPIASSMAYTSAVMRRPGEDLVDRYNQPWFHGLVLQSGGRMLPSQGGVLCKAEDGTFLGATGVSGGTGEQDKACAEAAISAVQSAVKVGASG